MIKLRCGRKKIKEQLNDKAINPVIGVFETDDLCIDQDNNCK